MKAIVRTVVVLTLIQHSMSRCCVEATLFLPIIRRGGGRIAHPRCAFADDGTPSIPVNTAAHLMIIIIIQRVHSTVYSNTVIMIKKE